MGSLMLLLVPCAPWSAGVHRHAGQGHRRTADEVIFLPVILMYCRMCAFFPGKDFSTSSTRLFGRFGRCADLLMAAYAVLTGALVLQNYTEFTVVISRSPRLKFRS